MFTIESSRSWYTSISTSDPTPRIVALQNQILSILRYGPNQSVFHMKDRAVYRTNESLKNNISLKIVSDGVNHVLDKLTPYLFLTCIIPVSIDDPKMLGFEAHRILFEHLSYDYDCTATRRRSRFF